MEIQWPLILFTTLVAWAAGVFAAQCLFTLKGEGKKTQMTAWIVAAVLLVAGGISVFFHLGHWERIFNGFGNITSGITLELIGIVLLAVAAVIYLAFMRRSEDGASVPRWLAIVGIVMSAVLVAVMGSSYMMASLPAWNSVFQVLSLLGAACIMGPATMVALMDLRGDTCDTAASWSMIVGSIVNFATTAIYILTMALVDTSSTNVGYYFDSTSPNAGMVDTSAVSPFAGDSTVVTVLALVLALVPVVCALVGKKQGNWKIWASLSVACAVSATVLLRVVFYQMGFSAFPFF